MGKTKQPPKRVRCPKCGGKVVMPCLLCTARARPVAGFQEVAEEGVKPHLSLAETVRLHYQARRHLRKRVASGPPLQAPDGRLASSPTTRRISRRAGRDVSGPGV